HHPELLSFPTRRSSDLQVDPSGLEVVRAFDEYLATEAVRLPEWNDLSAALAVRVTPPRSRVALTRLAALGIRAGSKMTDIAHALDRKSTRLNSSHYLTS